jgi:hypothetical protein
MVIIFVCFITLLNRRERERIRKENKRVAEKRKIIGEK